MELCTYKIRITGTVQGVGFRPFVYALSQRYVLQGTVCNTPQGVVIFVNTDTITLKQFLIALEYEHPLLASIQSIEHEELDYTVFEDFKIIKTEDTGAVTANIPPDVSICSECEKELLDSKNRRFKYPFITCTHCGVRYSIINTLPYDRVNTSMKFFKMCILCEEEYNNPLDRRYHAQPIGCFECGPQLQLLDNVCESTSFLGIQTVVDLFQQGKIIAVKGVGGYHLMCDARNEKAVETLRKRKKRVSKPFAMMVRDIQMAKEYASINEKESELLSSKERPIVILSANTDKTKNLHPQSSKVGVFLPYTPLHLLLLESLQRPLLATSANVVDEPICTNLEDLKKLEGVYDYVLEHNRDIVNGCDDSVLFVVKNQTLMLRRARGYAPVQVKLPFKLEKNVLALGANQKTTIAIGFDNQVILSPHIGDLHTINSMDYYKKNIKTLENMYSFTPEVIAYDKHPHYETTKIAQELLASKKVQSEKKVQHHFAHVLAVMAEKALTKKVFAVAFDGTGFGDDGNLWGGEFMLCDYDGYERIAHIAYFKLLGGAKAIKEPKRVALALLFDLYAEKVFALNNPTTQSFSQKELRSYFLTYKKGINAPLSSSVGRLFDAVASLLGVCHVMSYEGESGILLEELYDASVQGHYRFGYENTKIDILPLLEDILSESDVVVATSKFFHTLVKIIELVYEPYDLDLVLSGGVFQNRVLVSLVLDKFPQAILPNIIPPNDGGIALGQVVARINTEDKNND
ncbi:carbamoyltransferase HypF [Sulfurimonas sp. SAG-AH-194-I05]|nr:carbamoyltransferase HypF [Sulfurimonas sp. SAG-AH-194-I05]MDF1874800.1 carbamoyltransferase HypF [Sulfurimonas sp. SAG-AH-194-I05]